MKSMGGAVFEEQCPALPDRLDAEGVIITKRGKPVARVVPYERQFADCISSPRHRIEIRGDIGSTGVRWNADAES